MKVPPFKLERFFAAHEFSAPYLLCASDCESVALGELLALEPGSREKLETLWLGYTESLGHPDLRAAIAAGYRTIAPHQVLVHAGAQEAIFNLMNAVLDPGGHVIVHWPCYQSLAQVPESIGCRVTRWEADPHAGWELHLHQLESALRPETRLVVINLPHNPTGYLMSSEKLAEVVARVGKHGALLLVDEVYRGLEYDDPSRLPAGCDLGEHVVSLGVLSKSHGLAGLRTGWIATRNEKVFRAMAAYKDYTTICHSAPSEFLATIAVRHAERLMARNRNLVVENRARLVDFFARHERILEWIPPRAGCIAFPRLRQGSADDFAREVLDATGVLLAPGSHFGYDPAHFRVGFGRRNFAEALARLDAFLRP